MKTQMKTLFVFLMAAAVAVSCGKNESGGGGSSTNGGLGNIQNLDGNSQQAIQRLNSWYHQSQEGNVVSDAFAKVQQTQNQNSGQNCIKILKQNICFDWYYGGGGSNQPNITSKTCIIRPYGNTSGAITTKTVNVNTPCYTQTGGTQYTKSSNAALNDLFQGNSNLVPIQAIESGTITTVSMGYNNGSNVPIKIFVIDRGVHSIYNPVQLIDQSGATTTYTINDYPY